MVVLLAVSTGKKLRESVILIVQTELTQPESVGGMLKAMVSPEPSALAWFMAQRSENIPLEHVLGSAVVFTVSVLAARAAGN